MKTNFQSVASQAADVLREEILKGTWVGALPGERKLAEKLKVSRKTIRAALAELRTDSVLTSRPGRTNEISRPRRGRKKAESLKRVGLLMREPLERMRPYTVLWVNELRERLQTSGLQLEIHHSNQYFGKAAHRSLEKLVETMPTQCWVLTASTRTLQEWFHAANLPTVVAGSAHADIPLSSVDSDHRALCRHATTFLLRNGHRKIALFLSEGDLGGDLDSEAGFHEALADYPAKTPLIFRMGSGREEIIYSVKRALEMGEPVTAFVLSSPFSYLTVLSYLGSIGKRIPEDISVISAQEEPFFAYLHPSPTHYIFSPARFASELGRQIKKILRSGHETSTAIRIMPDFVRGESAMALKAR